VEYFGDENSASSVQGGEYTFRTRGSFGNNGINPNDFQVTQGRVVKEDIPDGSPPRLGIVFTLREVLHRQARARGAVALGFN